MTKNPANNAAPRNIELWRHFLTRLQPHLDRSGEWTVHEHRFYAGDDQPEEYTPKVATRIESDTGGDDTHITVWWFEHLDFNSDLTMPAWWKYECEITVHHLDALDLYQLINEVFGVSLRKSYSLEDWD